MYSPTLRYLRNHPSTCPSAYFSDRVTGRRGLLARVALQVEVNPGSYKVGPPSFGPISPPDPHFKLDETEWLSTERGNTVISALLLCVQEGQED